MICHRQTTRQLCDVKCGTEITESRAVTLSLFCFGFQGKCLFHSCWQMTEWDSTTFHIDGGQSDRQIRLNGDPEQFNVLWFPGMLCGKSISRCRSLSWGRGGREREGIKRIQGRWRGWKGEWKREGNGEQGKQKKRNYMYWSKSCVHKSLPLNT